MSDDSVGVCCHHCGQTGMFTASGTGVSAGIIHSEGCPNKGRPDHHFIWPVPSTEAVQREVEMARRLGYLDRSGHPDIGCVYRRTLITDKAGSPESFWGPTYFVACKAALMLRGPLLP